MTAAHKKSRPWQATGIEGKTTEDAFRMKEQGKATAAPESGMLREFPRPLRSFKYEAADFRRLLSVRPGAKLSPGALHAQRMGAAMRAIRAAVRKFGDDAFIHAWDLSDEFVIRCARKSPAAFQFGAMEACSMVLDAAWYERRIAWE